jgi:hypothetical protein
MATRASPVRSDNLNLKQARQARRPGGLVLRVVLLYGRATGPRHPAVWAQQSLPVGPGPPKFLTGLTGHPSQAA